MELICLNGLQTNPDVPGCERVVGTWLRREWLELPREEVIATDFNAPPELLGAEKIFMVKGWNRSVCGLAVLFAAFKQSELLKAWCWKIASLLDPTRTVASFASAYSLGKHESAAALNLLRRVPSEIREGLTLLAQLQKVCALFVACIDQFKAQVPSAFSESALAEVNKAFEKRHADADLLAMLDGSVEKRNLEKAQELSQQLLQTTWQQMELQVEQDKVKLQDWSRKFTSFMAKQGSLDVKYLSDRYAKGKEEISKLLAEKHRIVRHPSICLGHSAIVQMQGEMGPDGLTILIADATLWPTRPLSIDEAVQVAQGVTGGNCNSVSFWCLPQWHSSAGKVAVLKNRRLLEDKVVGNLGCLAGVAPGMSDVPRSCSRALLGSIDEVDRARVNELSNPEPDKPLVQQRGVQACVDILEQLLCGMHAREAQPVLLWSQAAWQLQRAFLQGASAEDRAWDVRFLSIYHDDDTKHAESCQQLICGRAMQQWWDTSSAAGPKSRAAQTFSEEIPDLDCLIVLDNELKSLG
ncbi:unnamed protein product [Durusdinium trenchii]|uniref:Uncharacterized protein n=2 Tax=Durusdinium trenchii TaxID=1381693 RepID=A0ABP0PJ37_9DINO